MATIVLLSTYSARADENRISPIPVSTGAPFTFYHTWHMLSVVGASVHVTMVYNNSNTPVYDEYLKDGLVFEPSNPVYFFNFRDNFPIPKMPVAGNLAVYLALVPQKDKNRLPPHKGELAFVLVPHCPGLVPHQVPVCQYATAEDWAIITPVR
jgi:hypothetical protein